MMLRRIMLRRNFEEDDDKDDVAPRIEPRTHTHTLCASLRSRNALQHFTRATSYVNLQEKCRDPKPRRRPCASLRSRNQNLQEKCHAESQPRTQTVTVCEPARLRSRHARQHLTRATFYANLQENAAPQLEPRTQTHTLCEPAQSKRMSRFHKSNFIRKFTGKMPRPRAPAFTATVRTRQCGHTVWGNIYI